MKLTEAVQSWKTQHPNRVFFSLEFFPPKTDVGLINLYDRLDRFSQLNPLWIDVTWGAGGSTSNSTLKICSDTTKYNGIPSLMHLTCTNTSVQQIRETLKECQKNCIQNVLALRGDPPLNEEVWKSHEDGLCHAIDLVKLIKDEFGDYFCIGVAGYPEGHIENSDKEQDLLYLKEKVDAGASFIITQLFYDTRIFFDFVKKAREIGITVPILPGVLPIQTYAGFIKMTSFCKTFVPETIIKALEEIKHDDQKVKDYGVNLCVKMCNELIEFGVDGLHFYTLNLEVSVIRVIEALHLVDSHRSLKSLPWKPIAGRHESVRPIFWANRPKSYIKRTSAWDDFPNGRWGDKDSPAFGDHWYSMCIDPVLRSAENRRQMWGAHLNSIQDVTSAFCAYLSDDSKVSRLPWCSDRLGDETKLIRKQLLKLNRLGLLTINSQPRVNGALSSDPCFGWGSNGGFVFQKAYIEFFCSQYTLDILLANIKNESDLTYAITNAAGKFITNCDGSINAVTWGVFPGSEIIQPTVVDTESYMAWKDEAFSLWIHDWASIYEENSTSRKVIEEIYNKWYLVNIVDNNFVTGDLFGKLVTILTSAN